VRTDAIFRRTNSSGSGLFSNTFTTQEVNHAKKRVFKNTVFRRSNSSGAGLFEVDTTIPAVFRTDTLAFNQSEFQGSWALSNTLTIENVAIAEAYPSTVMGLVRTVAEMIVSLADSNNISRGRSSSVSDDVGITELLSRARDVARSIEESLVISHFTGNVRDVARTNLKA